jgi:hypothetical protein
MLILLGKEHIGNDADAYNRELRIGERLALRNAHILASDCQS